MWIKNDYHKHPDCLVNLDNVVSIDSYNQPINDNYETPYHIVFYYPAVCDDGELSYDRWMFADGKVRERCYGKLLALLDVKNV